MTTFAYIDASNLFYGGRKSLGWSIDYQKLRHYLKEKYQVSTIYFFGGVEIYRFPFDYLKHESVSIKELERYFIDLIENHGQEMTKAKLVLIDQHLKRTRFYLKLKKFGYHLTLKPVKSYEDEDGNLRRKANCDVDMAFYLMRDQNVFERVIILSGDGDFLPVLKFLRANKKEVLVLSRGPRTAKEIKRFAGDKFLDFEYLQTHLEFKVKI